MGIKLRTNDSTGVRPSTGASGSRALSLVTQDACLRFKLPNCCPFGQSTRTQVSSQFGIHLRAPKHDLVLDFTYILISATYLPLSVLWGLAFIEWVDGILM